MKKLFVAFSSFIAFLMLPTAALAATLTLSPATGTFNKGCDVTVKIELDTTGTNTDGTDVILNYEAGKMTITSSDITNGTIYSDYPGNSVDTSLGKVSISGISSVSSPFNGKGTFATLKFKVNAAATGATTLKFDFDPNDKTKTTDSNVVERGTIADVLSAVTDGSYTIGTGAGCATPGGGNGPGQGGLGQGGLATPSATIAPPPLKELNPGGNKPGLTDQTTLLVITGVLLTILGVAGLALL